MEDPVGVPVPSTREPAGGASTPLRSRLRQIPVLIAIGVFGVLVAGTLMVVRARSKTNKVALAEHPKPVTVIEATGTQYRASRRYVGTLEPWISASVGPQLVSAFVDTVLVRPGATARKGDVLATLDCRNASATSQAVAMQARALETRQQALANEASRVHGLLDGGFVSPNEAEQKEAQSASEQAQLLAEKAKLSGTSLEVNDCILRAPFDGEIATRSIDPGAFVKPGSAIVSIVDRSTVRITGDAPESDFAVVAPGTAVVVHVIATNKDVNSVIARRAPAADPMTRTVHFEMDVPDPEKTIPVGTTGEIRIDVGEPSPATVVPLAAASVRGSKASLFVIEQDVARARVIPVKGELAGNLYLDTDLAPGSLVVTEGRALLADGDRVTATVEASKAPSGSATPAARAADHGAPTADPLGAQKL